MLTYHLTDHHITLGACNTRKRRDAALQELWRMIRDALAGYGLCDTKHAWSLFAQWQKLRFDMTKKQKPGYCWSAKFEITEGHSVSLLSVRT